MPGCAIHDFVVLTMDGFVSVTRVSLFILSIKIGFGATTLLPFLGITEFLPLARPPLPKIHYN